MLESCIYEADMGASGSSLSAPPQFADPLLPGALEWLSSVQIGQMETALTASLCCSQPDNAMSCLCPREMVRDPGFDRDA